MSWFNWNWVKKMHQEAGCPEAKEEVKPEIPKCVLPEASFAAKKSLEVFETAVKESTEGYLAYTLDKICAQVNSAVIYGQKETTYSVFEAVSYRGERVYKKDKYGKCNSYDWTYEGGYDHNTMVIDTPVFLKGIQDYLSPKGYDFKFTDVQNLPQEEQDKINPEVENYVNGWPYNSPRPKEKRKRYNTETVRFQITIKWRD